MGIVINQEKCVGCGLCIETCPAGALYTESGKTYINEKCTLCGLCRDVCICAALTYVDKPETTAGLRRKIK